jgi:hypothetical protein
MSSNWADDQLMDEMPLCSNEEYTASTKSQVSAQSQFESFMSITVPIHPDQDQQQQELEDAFAMLAVEPENFRYKVLDPSGFQFREELAWFIPDEEIKIESVIEVPPTSINLYSDSGTIGICSTQVLTTPRRLPAVSRNFLNTMLIRINAIKDLINALGLEELALSSLRTGAGYVPYNTSSNFSYTNIGSYASNIAEYSDDEDNESQLLSQSQYYCAATKIQRKVLPSLQAHGFPKNPPVHSHTITPPGPVRDVSAGLWP